MAVGTRYKKIVVGRDTRTSGDTLRHAVTAGILASGSRCIDAGILPTPTLAYLTREYDAGIMITASHNPPQYNGLKLLNPDGSAFSGEQQDLVEEMVEGRYGEGVLWQNMFAAEEDSTGIEKHIARITGDFKNGINARVVIDCGCCAACGITPELLKRLGCDVIPLNCFPSGVFPHDVEPVEANLGDLMKAVSETGADLGIAHDGDADRMMAVDEQGRFVNGDKMLAILGKSLGAGKIVTTIDASMIIEEMQFQVTRTRVGDPYVSEELKNGGIFGGEPSGAWVFPAVSFCPDGIYAAALIASIASREKLSVIADNLASYAVKRGNINGNIACMDDLHYRLKARFNPLTEDKTDGIKLNLEDGWILIRPSGTEPKIRLSVEARNVKLAAEYYADCFSIINNYVKGKEK